MYCLPQAADAALSPGPLSQQQCPAGTHQHLGEDAFQLWVQARPPILMDSESGWEVLEPTSCPCCTYRIIGTEHEGSDVLLVLLGAREDTWSTRRAGCSPYQSLTWLSPAHLLQALQHSP